MLQNKYLNYKIYDILKLIPHRYPFILVDRILLYENKNFIRVLKNITMNDPLLQGHFPFQYIFPAVLSIESISQSAIILSTLNDINNKHKNGNYYITGIEKSRFKKIIVPGDQLIIEVKLYKEYKNLYFFEGKIFIQSKIVCYASVICKYVINIKSNV